MGRQATIGDQHPCFVIAEAGVNHNGDPALAHRLIDVAADSGADCVKFQTFRADALVSPSARKAAYQEETTGGGSQLEMLKRLELPTAVWRELLEHAEERRLVFLSTPFDEASADLLIELGVDLLKLGSGDLTNRPLIEHCALSGLPLILSTGMGDRYEVNAAVAWFRLAFQHRDMVERDSPVSYSEGGRIGLLHCVSSYPAPATSLNLRAIATMKRLTRLPIGFSDHSVGIAAPPLAVAAGACMIEKHFTLDRKMEGPDHRASLEPDQLMEMIQQIRQAEQMLGHGRKEPDPIEADVRAVARRSVVSLCEIPKGTIISHDMVGIRRPATGMPPATLYQAIGAKALQDIAAGEPLQVQWLEFNPPENNV